MGDREYPQVPQMPTPDPALKRFDRFIGTWEAKGRTLGAEEDDVSGRLAFEWLPGGFFVQQRVELTFTGFQVQALEVIGYDPERGVFPSTVYSSVVGIPLAYEYDLQGDDVTIRTEFNGGATFKGRFAEDGDSFSGGWRPDTDAPGNVAYDITGRRAKG